MEQTRPFEQSMHAPLSKFYEEIDVTSSTQPNQLQLQLSNGIRNPVDMSYRAASALTAHESDDTLIASLMQVNACD